MQLCDPTPEVYEKATLIAEQLKQQLEKQLIGKRVKGWKCGCRRHGAGCSKIVSVEYPQRYTFQIAFWPLWTCRLKDKTGKIWFQGISAHIPRCKLYAMFRNAFAGLNLLLAHPEAVLCYHNPETSIEFFFRPSGRHITLTDNTCVYLRPKEDLTNAAWTMAELRVDCRLEGYSDPRPSMVLHVDALDAEQQHGRGKGGYHLLTRPEMRPTYFIKIAGNKRDQDQYVPVVRLVWADEANGKGVFELDESVEVFIPINHPGVHG